MKDLDLHPLYYDDDDDDDRWYLSGGFADFVRSFETDTVVSERDNDYQGDEWYLLHDNGEYAMLSNSFGSCGGCDWIANMEGSSKAEWYAERDNIWNKLQWMTAPEMYVFLTSTARNRDHHYYADDNSKYLIFLSKATAAVEPREE